MKVRQVEEEMDTKGLRYDDLHEAYQSERRDKENLKKRLDDIGQVSQVQVLNNHNARLQKEVMELRESKGKMKSDLEDSQYKLEIEEKRTKDYGAKVEEMAHEIRSMEHQKKRTEIKLEAVMNEKQEIETKLHNKRENEEKHQPGQQQILHDDLEKENQRLKNVLRKYEDRLKSPGTAKDLELLTAKVEDLEEEKKALRNDCDKYCKDNEQLRKRIESFYTGQMSQGLSSVDAMLQENMKRMERDKEYLRRQLDNAEREADDLRKKAEQKKRDDSKIQEMIRKEKNFKTERERLEHEIDDLKFTNKKLEEQLKQEKSKIIETERDFDKMNPKRKKGVSFSISNDEPQSILKKGSYTDEREWIDDESIPASTPTYEDLMKMKEDMAKIQSGLMSLEKDNRRREKEN
ncbi:PREDICTED: intracellular protein transport protein USO1-like [Amphimedon queenslandica]|nr:PREDICTED: intracellular protein transport protein USO1-like [Amphimedon queenslandica]|eukprot:XP_019862241.1 PREDICTED: intracellular protein transport protein USO1-like [Amphimedon queenslandica]